MVMSDIYASVIYTATCAMGLVTLALAGKLLGGLVRNWTIWLLPRHTILALLIMLVGATIQAQKVMTAHVDSQAEESGDGSAAHPFKTINAAVGALSVHTNYFRLWVEPGVYAESVDLDGLSVLIEASTNAGERVIASDGAAFCVRSANVPEKRPVPTLQGFTLAGAATGAVGFVLKECLLDGLAIGTLKCQAKESVFEGCGIAAQDSELIRCDVRGSTEAGVVECAVESTYLTNNCCKLAVAVDSELSACLVADNFTGGGAAVTNGVLRSTTVAGNRCAGVCGAVTLLNSISVNNVCGVKGLCNFTGGVVSMTNSCSYPMPPGADNIECDFPIRPDTYRILPESPAIYAGSTNYLGGLTSDLAGRSWRRNYGKMDIGAFGYVYPVNSTNATHKTPVPVPYEWLRDVYYRKLVAIAANNHAYLVDQQGRPIDVTAVNVEHRGTSVAYGIWEYKWSDKNRNWYWSYETKSFVYEEMAMMTSGKTFPDGEPIYWWQEYVMGTDPNEKDDYFRAYIEVGEDGPEVTWWPDKGADRYYFIKGKRELTDGWQHVPDAKTSGCRFFSVGVDLP